MTVEECRQLLYQMSAMKKKGVTDWHISDYGEGYNQAISDIKSIIVSHAEKEQLTSLVEAVRCKDCKKYSNFDANNCKRLRFHFCTKFGNITRENDFCSYGERKEVTR